MKKNIPLILLVLISLPGWTATKTTTIRTYDSMISTPATRPDIDDVDEAYFEEGEEDMDQQRMEDLIEQDMAEQRMEENNRYTEQTIIESDNEWQNDQDRVRTNRERKALNTSGNASDDR